jgi:hypothetical protein
MMCALCLYTCSRLRASSLVGQLARLVTERRAFKIGGVLQLEALCHCSPGLTLTVYLEIQVLGLLN